MSDQSKARSNLGNDHANGKRSFRTLRFVGKACYYLAYVVFLIPAVGFPIYVAASTPGAFFLLGILVGVILGVVIALPLLAASDFIEWMLEVAEELRKNNALLERALSR
jgi:hypothetical protein